jgi:hypothetical protein
VSKSRKLTAAVPQIRDRWRFAPTVPMQWPARTNKEQAAALLKLSSRVS